MSDIITANERAQIDAWLARNTPRPIAPGVSTDPLTSARAYAGEQPDWNGYRLARERIIARHKRMAVLAAQIARANREAQALRIHDRAKWQEAMAAVRHAGLTI